MRRLMQAEASVADAGGISHIIYIRKTNSVCDLQTAREADGLKYKRTMQITRRRGNVVAFYCSSQHEWDRERKRLVQVGACFTAEAKQALSPHHV